MTTTMAEILSKDIMQQEEADPPLPLKPQGSSKVFSKLFSRESSAAAPSFRVYYGVASAGSVPFLWESQPGTPKNDAVSAATLPPLTPPPSYYTATAKQQAIHHKPAAPPPPPATPPAAAAGRIILHHRRSRSSSSSSSPTSACSSSNSSSAFSSASSSLSFRSAQSPASSSSMRSRVFAFSSSAAGDDDGDSEEEEPATCFSSVRHESFRAFKTCRVAATVKSALASVGGHHAGTTTAQRV
ncbi:hypothetical protein PR202_gb26332 [Eleusine coracana subsp. coracana]|uniref:Uncharacterized protein n=1 Tax=Eleusine coracana subsp. coracana TaxID=191504 RepID=A0AAV5FRK1_ELECO|nr:hypothetical protein PR202_gb26332 [Eleusine coracana subsp. coracana]